MQDDSLNRGVLLGALVPALAVIASAVAPAPEDTVEAVLADLIEETNALESFHVLYAFGSSGEAPAKEGTMELIYEAPDLGRYRIVIDDVSIDLWVVGDESYTQGPDGDWQRGRFPELSEAQAFLYESFPRAAETLEPGLLFSLAIQDKPDADETEFNIAISRTASSRRAQLGWLSWMKHRAEEVELEKDYLLVSGESFEMRVSREHGFPSLIALNGKDGPMEVRLLEIHLDEDLDPALTGVPAPARAAEIDAGIGDALGAMRSPARQRHEGFTRVHHLLAEGELSWDDDVHERWSSYVRELHYSVIEERSRARIEQTGAKFDQFAAQVRQHWERGESPERRAELEAKIAEVRAGWMHSASGVPLEYLDRLPPLEIEDGPPAELLEVEAEVVKHLHEQLLREPLLARFDETLQAVWD